MSKNQKSDWRPIATERTVLERVRNLSSLNSVGANFRYIFRIRRIPLQKSNNIYYVRMQFQLSFWPLGIGSPPIEFDFRLRN